MTSESVIPVDARFSGVMDSRDAITVAGLPVAEAFFRRLDPAMTIELLVADGDRVMLRPTEADTFVVLACAIAPVRETVTATNAMGTSAASSTTASITPEEVATGLPIWLLYQATQ